MLLCARWNSQRSISLPAHTFAQHPASGPSTCLFCHLPCRLRTFSLIRWQQRVTLNKPNRPRTSPWPLPCPATPPSRSMTRPTAGGAKCRLATSAGWPSWPALRGLLSGRAPSFCFLSAFRSPRIAAYDHCCRCLSSFNHEEGLLVPLPAGTCALACSSCSYVCLTTLLTSSILQ